MVDLSCSKSTWDLRSIDGEKLQWKTWRPAWLTRKIISQKLFTKPRLLELIIEEAEEVVAETTIIEIKNDDNYTFSNNVILWKIKKIK